MSLKSLRRYASVEGLRATGWKIVIDHQRGLEDFGINGITTIYITDRYGKHAKGRAVCAKPDTFDRRRGVRIALGRALLALYGR
mgnify:CR=1 FL=1